MTAPAGGRREDTWVLAIDLGTGGPKVGLVSVVGTVAWHEHRAVPTAVGPSGSLRISWTRGLNFGSLVPAAR